MVIRTAHHVLILLMPDPNIQVGLMRVLRFCFHSRTHHIHHINGVIVSHGDNDHIGGAEAILNQMSIPLILSSVANSFLKALAEKTFLCGKKWIWDGVCFSFLSPEKEATYQGNNSSCVLRIQVHQYSRQFYYPVILRNPKKSGFL